MSINKYLRKKLPERWERILNDPRRDARRWGFHDLMRAVSDGLLSGCKGLRELEVLTAASGQRVPDTTIHDLLVSIDPEPIENEIAKMVKEANRFHELDNKELPVRLTVIDGKNISSTTYKVDEYSIRRSQNGCEKYVQHAIRALHASSTVKLLMGQYRVPIGSNEKAQFPYFLKDLVKHYGGTKLLEVFSLDAGFTSINNSRAIIESGYDYIFAIKDPRVHTITKCAMELLGSSVNPNKVETENINGKQITRSLYRCLAPKVKGWEHASEIWRIHKESLNLKTGTTAEENHYYVTSLPKSKLSNANVLKAVRTHWSIENNANWVMDVAWKEDSKPWCNQAIEFISLLRIMAYNIVARFKLRHLRRLVARTWTWEQTLYFIKTELFPLNKKEAFATL